MVMFSSGAFGDDLSDDSSTWGALSDFYQSGTKDETGFQLDTSGLTAPPPEIGTPYTPTEYVAPEDASGVIQWDMPQTLPIEPQDAPSITDEAAGYLTGPPSINIAIPEAESPVFTYTPPEVVAPQQGSTDDFFSTIEAAGYDPDNIADQQYSTLLQMMQSYGLATNEIRDLADLFTDTSRIDELEALVNQYDFDADSFRASQQAAIAQGVKDISQQTIGQLVASGQLNSSAGQNYMAGSQAQYLTQSLAQLEDRIRTYEADEAAKKFGWVSQIADMEDAQKRAYADLIGKSLGFEIEGSQKFFDGLSQVLTGEIGWDTFLSNYTQGDSVSDITWGDYSITGEDFSKIGTVINNVMNDVYGSPWDTPIDQGNGYSVIKSAVGPDQYKLTYLKDGNVLFDYTFDKDADYGDVARALWSRFDDGMKDIWGELYFSGVAPEEITPPEPPAPEEPPVEPDVPQPPDDGWWSTQDFSLNNDQYAQIGEGIDGLWTALDDNWKPFQLTDGRTVEMSRYHSDMSNTDWIQVKDPSTGEVRRFQWSDAIAANPEYQGHIFWNEFKDLFANHWNDTYGWGY